MSSISTNMDNIFTANSVILITMKEAPEKFIVFLKDLLKSNNLGIREAARLIGVSHPTISDIITYGKRPSINTCIAIAKAFDIPEMKVIRLAYDLQPGPDDDTRFDDWREILKKLPENKWEQLWKIAEIYLEDERKEAGKTSLKPEPTTK